MKLLLMCEKSKPYVKKFIDGKYKEFFYSKQDLKDCVLLNETIVAECDFEVEEIKVSYEVDTYEIIKCFTTKTIKRDIDFYTKSCLYGSQIDKYLNGNKGYAIHIKNLHIFDEPKALRDYTTRKLRDYDSIVCDSCTNAINCKKCSYYYDYQEVVRTPHNMMKVCEWDLEDKILIPLKPSDLCKILNKEKTIIIRKKVLREMLK